MRGYNENLKAYRCIELKINKVYISKDVIFNEKDIIISPISY